MPRTCTVDWTESELQCLENRFFSKVDATARCWIWMAAIVGGGYGVIYVKRKPIMAHRMAWVLAHGEIPESQLVLHHCDNPRCVNVDHLFLGTYKDNEADKLSKGRNYEQRKTRCPRGHLLVDGNLRKGPSRKGRECVQCAKAYRRAWAVSNPDKIREYDRRKYLKRKVRNG
jgi:hypothetical protein